MAKDPSAYLAKLTARMLGDVAKDWREMIGIDLSMESSGSCAGGPDDLAKAMPGKVVMIETQITGDAEGPVHFIFTEAFAARVVGTMVMLPEGTIKEKEENGLEESDLEAFQEMANLLCGTCNTLFQKLERQIRVSQAVEDLHVFQLELPGDGHFPANDLVGVQVEFGLDGRKFPAMQVFSSDLGAALKKRVPLK
ncbi:MAG: hypothetical protein GY723_18065 [bacterium]|nr:hypothetical protein [bacterium]MCP5070700.1 hypothetical protein [bacterium]